jgi:NTP pyrophosphatase (non-canonical NTP hydrolase)
MVNASEVPLSDDVNQLVLECYGASFKAGWWTDPETGKQIDPIPLIPTKLCLIHSEISEALEGARKDKMDDHLPHRKSIEVELADAVIRICDLAGALNLDLGTALVEKMRYNAQRADHKMSNRAASGGKKF